MLPAFSERLFTPWTERAVQAILFVRDLDTSLLGQNELGLENFDTLRKCTDDLVNDILHVRQLLKRRRRLSSADGDGKHHSTFNCLAIHDPIAPISLPSQDFDTLRELSSVASTS